MNAICKKRFYGFVGIILCFLGANQSAFCSDKMLSISINPKEGCSANAENVEVYLIFKNISNENYYINTAMNYFAGGAELQFEIADKDGVFAKKNNVILGKRKVLNKGDYYLLKKGETYTKIIDVSLWYQLKADKKYSIKATYSHKNNSAYSSFLPNRKLWREGYLIWEGKTTSNLIHISTSSKDCEKTF